MSLHQKSRDYILFGCAYPHCPVVTFIRSDECPNCKQPGIWLRGTDWETGQPANRPLVS